MTPLPPDNSTQPQGQTTQATAADPFDPSNLRLSQDFLKTGGVKKHVTSIPARKPTREEWFQVHPSPEYALDTLILKLKDSNETYLIAPAIRDELAAEATVSAHRLFTAVNRQGGMFVWPAKLPTPDGRQDRWSESALEAAEAAKKGWVRVQADMGIGAYVFFTPMAELQTAQWPEMTFQQILKLAFRNNLIESNDHFVLRKLRGEI